MFGFHTGDGFRPVPFLFLGAAAVWGQDCAQLLSTAEQAFQRQQYAQSAAEFQRALAGCPQRLEIHVALGQVEYLLGREMEAEENLKAALGIDGAHVPALYAMGRLYYQQKRYSEAAERLARVVELEPKHYRGWDNLGLVYDALNRDSDALKSFFKALDLVMKDHPEYDWAHANLADFFLKRNQYEKAFQLAAEAARRNPQSARNCFLTGKALVKLEKHELSLRWLEQAVKLDSSYSEAYYLLAQTYRRMGRAEDSAKALERFRELSKSGTPRR
jgi:tetratricopeptide (TPR) repeat protein